MRLSQSHDPSRGFHMLNQVDLIHFLASFLVEFFFQFHPPKIQSYSFFI